MLLAKQLTLSLTVILLLLLSTTVLAQPQANNGAAKSAPPAESSPANAIQKSEPAATTAPDKNADDRLPFMANTEHDNQQAAPSTGGLLLRTLGALLLIVGLIVAAAWGMKRWGGARFGAPREDAPELAILNSVSLGDRRSVAIVRFGQRNLLIGSTPQSVTLLAETEGEEVVPRAQSVADILNQTNDLDFAEQLKTATGNNVEPEWKTGEEGVQW